MKFRFLISAELMLACLSYGQEAAKMDEAVQVG